MEISGTLSGLEKLGFPMLRNAHCVPLRFNRKEEEN
jgi:hypothetical protein